MSRIKCIAVLGAFLVTAFTANSQVLTYPIVGTGVTICFGNAGPIPCPTGASDAFYGQFPGTAPSYHDNGDGTISDLNTGLMWVKSRGIKVSWDNAVLLASSCAVGGYHDWRMPSIKELYSLINFNGKSAQSPDSCHVYLDTNYFQMTYGHGGTAMGSRTIDAQDWSATMYTGLTMGGDTTIFGVNFIDGRIKGYPKYFRPSNAPDTLYVRYVRGNTNYGKNRFKDNGDSTITDSATGLMWAKNDAGYGMNWGAALAYAQSKNSASYLGHTDWRLPHAKELQSIVDYDRSPMATNSAAIDPLFNCSAITNENGNTDYPFYWSSTTHLENQFGVYTCFGKAMGWMQVPPGASYYKAIDVHGAGAQRSDPKTGSVTAYHLGTDSLGGPCYGMGPQGDVIRINNYARLVRTAFTSSGVDNRSADHSIDIYPNPAGTWLTISSADMISSLVICNLLGQNVWTDTYNTKEIHIDVSALPSGVYFLKVNGTQIRKFIKQ